jgi:GMP synthase (glutamine-hydrolysing)
VLDFGGQYCHLIVRRIRDLGVYSEIIPCDTKANEIVVLGRKFNIKGLILSGGPSSVYIKDAPTLHSTLLNLELPILGLCYGHQLIAQLFNGKVQKGYRREYGPVSVIIDNPIRILKNMNPKEKVWMSHYDTVRSLPDDFEVLAHTESCPIAAFRHKERPIYGMQWHPEVVHTEHGTVMLKNFLFDVCKCEANWKPTSLIESIIREIRESVGQKKAIIGLSGGIDSSTASILASKALGTNLTAVFVDHGLMRENETEFVKNTFSDLELNLTIVNAKERFLNRLKGIVDPEEKRRIIGEEFIRVFEEVAAKTESEYLLQGTIYPDRIESGVRKRSEKIKSHHNVGGLPTKMDFKSIIEPLKDLYKDEVRVIAESLNMPEILTKRQPFPGPGLAVRIIGEVTSDRVDLLRKADDIVVEEIEKNEELKGKLWQYFAVLTNVRSTGVKGDSRAYGYVLALRAVQSKEAMTASFARIPYDILERISTRIINELTPIVRVVYDITHKPPATIEWE